MMQQLPPINEIDEITGILKSQHAIAEIVETFRVKNIIHDEMKNLQMLQKFGSEFSPNSDVMFGNKIALLSGDFLSANIILSFASLRLKIVIKTIMRFIHFFIFSHITVTRTQSK